MKKQLMKISVWRKKTFAEGSEPSMKTCRKWIDEGTIPGERIGACYYVDLARMQKTGNALVDRVLAA